jgi:hypothetical protein
MGCMGFLSIVRGGLETTSEEIINENVHIFPKIILF